MKNAAESIDDVKAGGVRGLVAHEVTKSFGGVYAARDVSISIGDREIVGLIGPNGAGKTSLMNAISGAIRFESGQVLIDGEDIAGMSMDRCAQRGVARTFQNIRVFSELTVLQNIQVAHATALRHRREHVSDAPDAILSRLGLATFSHRKATTLAYGLQRRIEIARALALCPRVMLLDEPAAGMNEQETEALMGTIRDLSAKNGIGILVIDHDLRFIMTLCSRIYVMDAGQVVAHDAPDAIRANPKVQEIYLGARTG